jgi:acid-sensing ion channel, other
MPRSKSMENCDYRHEYHIGHYTVQTVRLEKENVIKCACLDECDSVKYQTKVIATKMASPFKGYVHRHVFKTVSLQFKFKNVDIVTLRRYESITFSEFLAQAGGMLGLFAGISALSIIEFVYFVTLRWMTNVWRMIFRK